MEIPIAFSPSCHCLYLAPQQFRNPPAIFYCYCASMLECETTNGRSRLFRRLAISALMACSLQRSFKLDALHIIETTQPYGMTSTIIHVPQGPTPFS